MIPAALAARAACGFDRGDQAVVLRRDGLGHCGVVLGQMLGQQIVAELQDTATGSLGTGPFGGQQHVAFRVQPQGPVVVVRRPDPQIGVVDDHHLGMDIDLGALVGHRVIDAEASAMIQPLRPPFCTVSQAMMPAITTSVICLA